MSFSEKEIFEANEGTIKEGLKWYPVINKIEQISKVFNHLADDVKISFRREYPK